MERNRTPYRQGELDGLCGVYAVVNVVHYLCGPLTQLQARRLFEELLEYLEANRPLTTRIHEGTLPLEIGRMFTHVVMPRYPIARSKPFHCRKNLSLETFWGALEAFLEPSGRIVLSNVNGVYDHWTLIRAASPRALLTFDSDGLHRLNRIFCMTGSEAEALERESFDEQDGESPIQGVHHIFYPQFAFFLSLSE